MPALREAALAGLAGAVATAATLLVVQPRDETGFALAGLTVVVMAFCVFRLRRPVHDRSSN